MKVIVAGGRDFNNYSVVRQILSKLIDPEADTIICGDARGADMQGAMYASQYGIPIQHFPAYWDTYGKTAGFIRNAEMGDYADCAIIFWDGQSHGTKHMIETMKRLKKPYCIYNYDGNLIERRGMYYG